MVETVVMDSEYNDASQSYNKIASKAEKATKHFIKTVAGLINNRTIAGQTAKNIANFMGEMNSALGSTFNAQVSHTAKLNKEYLAAIDEADKEMYGGSRTGNAAPSYIDSIDQPYADTTSMIKLNKPAMMKCIETLRTGPMNDIKDCTERMSMVKFSVSKGAVKNQSVIVRSNILESLNALTDIFSAVIVCLEGVASAMEEADAKISRSFTGGVK